MKKIILSAAALAVFAISILADGFQGGNGSGSATNALHVGPSGSVYDGGSITNLNAAAIVQGIVPAANLPTVATNGGMTRTMLPTGAFVVSNTATFNTFTLTTNMALDFTNVTMWFGSLTGTNGMFLLNKTTGNTNVILLK